MLILSSEALQYTTYTGGYQLPRYHQKKVLVIGAAGLIGSAICKYLSESYDIYTYDIKPTVYKLGAISAEHYAVIDCGRYDDQTNQTSIWSFVIDAFKRQGHGRLILFSSIYGHKVPDFGMYIGTEIKEPSIDYAMDKAATEQATRYLAEKLKPYHIQVNCIAPGGILNGHSEVFQDEYQTAGGTRMIETKNLLPVIDMLLHEDNVVNGAVIPVDGGWQL